MAEMKLRRATEGSIMSSFKKGATRQTEKCQAEERRKMHILCIEDDLVLAQMLKVRLQRLGYTVELERNGERGLAGILRAECDLTVLDYRLPGRDGLQILEALQTIDPMPMVIMLSSSEEIGVAVEAMRLGAADYVIKEMNCSYLGLLESTIKRCLEKQRMRTEQRAAERKLARVSEQLAGTFATINEGLSVFDKELKLVVLNERFATLYGYPPELAQAGTPLESFFEWQYDQGQLGTADRGKVIAQKVASAVPHSTQVYEIAGPAGIVIEVRANPMPNGGYVSTHLDITARKNIELAMRKSEESYKQISEFATSVIHNVGNILSTINVSCGALYRTLQDSKVAQLGKVADLLIAHTKETTFLSKHPKGKLLPNYLTCLSDDLCKEKQEATDEVQSVLKNLLLITQIIEYQQSQGKRDEAVELLDLRQVVEDALNVKMDTIMRERITVHAHFDTFLIRSQKSKLTHVLINLIKNAVESIAAQPDSERILTLQSGQVPAGELYFSIRDTGVGVMPENLGSLFSHGFTTKSNGHGFGLHYCANSMHEMNSRIEVSSEGLGRGATFRLVFPAIADHCAKPKTS